MEYLFAFQFCLEYLLAFQFWYCELFVGNWWEGRRGFNQRLVRGCGLGQKVLFRASWNRIFFHQDLSRSNKHDRFWHFVLTGYFYILWAIAVSDFLPLKVYKNLGLPLSSINFMFNSHADNHFYKYIYVSNIIQYEISFFIKIHVEICYIQIWFKRETPPLFSNKSHDSHKKLFAEKNFFFLLTMQKYWITCCTQIMSHVIWVDEITGQWYL